MGSEMIVVDVLSASQVEQQDYVRFTDTNNTPHSGMVLDVEDLGDVFVITLSDDDEGDSVSYEVSADSSVQLLMYDAVAV